MNHHQSGLKTIIFITFQESLGWVARSSVFHEVGLKVQNDRTHVAGAGCAWEFGLQPGALFVLLLALFA